MINENRCSLRAKVFVIIVSFTLSVFMLGSVPMHSFAAEGSEGQAAAETQQAEAPKDSEDKDKEKEENAASEEKQEAEEPPAEPASEESETAEEADADADAAEEQPSEADGESEQAEADSEDEQAESNGEGEQAEAEGPAEEAEMTEEEEEEEEEEEDHPVTQTVTAGSATITANYNSGQFDEEVSLHGSEISFGAGEAAEGESVTLFAYDICFTGKSGGEREPDGAVDISISLNASPAEADLGDLQLLHEGTPIGAAISGDATAVSFSSSSFSVYTLKGTVGGALLKNSGEPATVKIGDASYESIEEAVAANESGTIEITGGSAELTTDLTSGNYKIVVGQDAVLTTGDGASMTCKSGSALIEVKEGGKRIANGGVFSNDNGSHAVTVEKGGSAEFHGGTFSATYEVILVYGNVSVIDGGSFTTPDGNTNNKAAAVCVSGADAKIGTISGGEFTGRNKSGGGVGLWIESGGSVDKITGGEFFGGSSSQIYPSGGQSGFGIRIGKNPETDTASVGEIAGGTFHGGRCIEVQTQTPVKITNAICEGYVDDDGEPVSYQGVHVDYKCEASIGNVTISKAKSGIANYGTITSIENPVISEVNSGIVNQSIIGTITGGSIESNGDGIVLAPYSRTTIPLTCTVDEINTNVTARDGHAISVEGGETYDYSAGSWVLTDTRVGKISGGVYNASGYSAISNQDGKIGTIGAAKASAGDDSVLENFGEYAEIDLIDGLEGEYTGDTWYKAVIENTAYSKIGEIRSGTFNGGNGMAISNEGTLTTISGGEFNTNGYYSENTGTIETISGGKFTAAAGEIGDGRDALINNDGGTINKITGGEFTGEKRGLRNCGSTIGEISGGTFTGTNGDGIRNQGGEINTITGGEFNGALNGLYNDASIGDITGGNYSGEGWFGIDNIGDGAEIRTIAISEDNKSVFKGPYAAVASYNGAKLGSVTGYGVYVGGGWGTIYTDASVPLEKDGSGAYSLTEDLINPGNGRYSDNENILSGDWQVPDGYHMSRTALMIPEMDDDAVDQTPFHFLTRANTIIFHGNGHNLDKGEAAKGFRDDNLFFKTYETPQAAVDGNNADGSFHFSEDGKEFLHWNTAADGSGDSFFAGDIVEFTKAMFEKGTDILLYAIWKDNSDSEPAPADTPADPDNPVDPVKPVDPVNPAEQDTPPVMPVAASEPAASNDTVLPVAAGNTNTNTARTNNPAPAAAITPAADNGPAEAVADNEVPMADIPDEETPAGLPAGGWALINLLCVIMSIIAAAAALFSRRDEENESRMGHKGRMKIAGAVLAVASAVILLITEDFTQPMILTDRYTILMILLMAAGLFAAVTAFVPRREEESVQQ